MKLHEQVRTLNEAINDMATWEADMRVYLNSAKFDGTLNDYINVGEMLRHLDGLRSTLIDAESARS